MNVVAQTATSVQRLLELGPPTRDMLTALISRFWGTPCVIAAVISTSTVST
jgi:hypothetical protein